MDSETRAALAALSDTMTAGFTRADHYFELLQLQFVEWRAEVRNEFAELRGEFTGLQERVEALTKRVDALTERVDALTERVDALTERAGRLEHGFVLFRDYVTREIGEIRLELRDLRSRSTHSEDLRRDLAALTARVERLEERQQD